MTITFEIDTERIERIKRDNDLVEIAGRYTELKRNSAADWHGPCPLCGDAGHKFHAKQDWFTCYGCGANGDTIKFVQLKSGIGFVEACDMLDGSVTLPAGERPAPRPQTPRRTGPSFDIDKVQASTEHAHRRLMDHSDTEAEAAREYLLKRGILPCTWAAFRLGFDPAVSLTDTWDADKKSFVYPKQPAITIPWYQRGKLVAVRYRFLQAHTYTDVSGEERTEKIKSLYGSWFGSGVLYGGHAFIGNDPATSTLALVEGELNACSIWQVARDTGVDVLSVGSESAKLADADLERISQYATVIVWLDDEVFVRQVMDRIPGAYGIKSLVKRNENGQPMLDRKGRPQKIDANDLLVSGQLSGLLAMHRFQAAKDRSEQERLLDQLWTAAQLSGGDSDAGLMEVVAHIAKTLDKEPTPRDTVEDEINNMDQQPQVDDEPTYFKHGPGRADTRPPLPPELHRQGMTAFEEAWQERGKVVGQYKCALGKNSNGFYLVAR